MTTPRLATLLVAGIFAVGACSPGAGSSPTPGPIGIDGRTFLSTAIDGRVLVAATRVRLSFRDGQASAAAGCNSMSGSYVIDAGRLVARSLATTEMACDPPRMDQDRWLADLLDGSSLVLEGPTLTLAKGGVRLTLLDRVVADPDRPLIGTRWVVDALISGESVSSLPVGVVAALTFFADRVDVETGCNTGGGPVAITPTAVTFGSMTLTKKACLGGASAVERAVTAVLSGEVAYAIEAGTLTLDGGAVGLVLRAGSPERPPQPLRASVATRARPSSAAFGSSVRIRSNSRSMHALPPGSASHMNGDHVPVADPVGIEVGQLRLIAQGQHEPRTAGFAGSFAVLVEETELLETLGGVDDGG